MTQVLPYFTMMHSIAASYSITKVLLAITVGYPVALYSPISMYSTTPTVTGTRF